MSALQALAGLATYVYFKTHEPRSTWTAIAISAFTPLLIHLTEGKPNYASSFIVFHASLFLALISYRLSPFHPLAKHPGPLLCKLTKFRVAWEAVKGDTHRYYQALHQTYGPIVRVGPNELSVIDKDAIPAVLGNQGMPRGPIWDGRRFGLLPDRNYDSLIDVRDTQIHARLRKGWNQAFSSAPLKNYYPMLTNRAEEMSRLLVEASLKAPAGGDSNTVATVDIARWISSFSFDFMGDLAFGGSFNLMKDGDVDGHWKRMEDGVLLPAISGQLPWLMELLKALPLVTAKRDEFKAFGTEMATRRIMMESKQQDLFYHLYEVPAAASGTPITDHMSLVVSNSLLTIVAGSDTTSTTLSCIICCLLAQKHLVSRLRDELDAAFTVFNDDGVPEIEIEKLLKLPFLGAVVNEGLRLAPAVPTNVQRAPGEGTGGRQLLGDKLFVPEGTAVNIPAYAMHRDPRYFSPLPEAFIPDRWLSDAQKTSSSSGSTTPIDHFGDTINNSGDRQTSDSAKATKFITNREAFVPFSYGPANCAGKPMALIELRFIVALLVQRFDMCYKGYSGAGVSQTDLEERERRWMHGLKDRFVFAKDPLEVEIKARKWAAGG